MSHQDIQKAISEYAQAYALLQKLQDTMPWIPGGDQKTGCIGEYYAYLYLQSMYGAEILSYGGHSEKGWDIKVDLEATKLIQVKTVSAFSKTRTISPIHKGWDELYIIYLSKSFEPQGFWIIADKTIFGAKEKITSAKCRNPNKERTGSAIIPFGENRIKELLYVIGSA
jgi:hypothetical protein